jgi:hypothetical protein
MSLLHLFSDELMLTLFLLLVQHRGAAGARACGRSATAAAGHGG